MSEPCTCKPGTYDGGWHEVRCAACEAEELAVWKRLMRKIESLR